MGVPGNGNRVGNVTEVIFVEERAGRADVGRDTGHVGSFGRRHGHAFYSEIEPFIGFQKEASHGGVFLKDHSHSYWRVDWRRPGRDHGEANAFFHGRGENGLVCRDKHRTGRSGWILVVLKKLCKRDLVMVLM